MQKSIAKQSKSNECVPGNSGINHPFGYTEFIEVIVYQISLSCSRSYIGKSKRFINVHLRKDKHSLSESKPHCLAAHCHECGCLPLFSSTIILSRHRNQLAREVIEASHIWRENDKCVSMPSIALSNAKFCHLSSTCRRSYQCYNFFSLACSMLGCFCSLMLLHFLSSGTSPIHHLFFPK